MSKITNDGLTRSGTGCFTAVVLYPYGNSRRQRVNCGTYRNELVRETGALSSMLIIVCLGVCTIVYVVRCSLICAVRRGQKQTEEKVTSTADVSEVS